MKLNNLKDTIINDNKVVLNDLKDIELKHGSDYSFNNHPANALLSDFLTDCDYTDWDEDRYLEIYLSTKNNLLCDTLSKYHIEPYDLTEDGLNHVKANGFGLSSDPLVTIDIVTKFAKDVYSRFKKLSNLKFISKYERLEKAFNQLSEKEIDEWTDNVISVLNSKYSTNLSKKNANRVLSEATLYLNVNKKNLI